MIHNLKSYSTYALINDPSIKIGFKISCTDYFYKPHLPSLQKENHFDILAPEKETEELLDRTITGGK